MSWFRKHIRALASFVKSASVTFYVSGTHKIAQPKDMMDLSHHLLHWADQQNAPRNLMSHGYESIVPDGTDFDKYTGTINWYIDQSQTESSDLDLAKWYAQRWLDEEMQPLGIMGSIREVNPSGMYVERKPSEGQEAQPINVIRIEIAENASTEIEQIPELNVSNNTAAILTTMLGLGEPEKVDLLGAETYTSSSGEVGIDEMEQRARSALTRGNISEFTREPEQYRPEEGGPTHYFSGMSADRLTEMLSRLIDMCQWARKNGFDKIYWA